MSYEDRVWFMVRTVLSFILLIFIAVHPANKPTPPAPPAYTCYRFTEGGTAVPCSEWYLWKGVAQKTLRSI